MQRCTLVLTGTMMGAILLGSGAALLAHVGNARMKIGNYSFSSTHLADARGTKGSSTARHDMSRIVTVAGEPRGIKSPLIGTGAAFSRVSSMPGTFRHMCALHLRMLGKVVVR